MSKRKKKLFRRIAAVSVFIVILAYFKVITFYETKAIQAQRDILMQKTLLPQPFAVNKERLIHWLEVLASDSMQGRKTGSAGNKKAQQLIVNVFDTLKLEKPANSYRHPFSFVHQSVDALFQSGKNYSTAYDDATNLMAFVKGSRYPDKFIVLSAHYDHLGIKEGNIYHGADDNASGVAALLEAAHYFAAHPPLHSVLFVAFDAEEQGLKGADAFFSQLPFPKEKLLFNLNLDMLSRNKNNEIFACGLYHYPFLQPLLRQVQQRSPVLLLSGHDKPMYLAGSVEDWTHSSDHGVFYNHQVPFIYLGVEDHADYHQPTDTADRIDKQFFIHVANTVLDLVNTADRSSLFEK